MRHTCRLFLAAILFTGVAGFSLAQDSAAPPPAPVPEVVQPVPELPVVPIPSPETPAVEPAPVVAAEPVAPIVPIVEPIAPVAVEPPAAINPVTTTAKRVAKKTSKKPAEKPAVPVAAPVQAAAPLASTAAADTTANPPPPEAAASTAPLKSVAPPPPPVQDKAVETSGETKIVTTMGIGGWLLVGLGVAALVGVITLFRRRKMVKDTSIVDLKTMTPELSPASVTRR